MYGAILISAGHISIGISSFLGVRLPFFLGLVLIVCGTGLLKPNISAIVGDLYPEGGARRDAGFSIYYMGINIGAFVGQLVTGFLGEKVGWGLGFGAAGVGMLLGLVTFSIFARRTLGDIGMSPTRHPDPIVQARRERTVKTTLAIGVAVLAIVIVLAATGMIIWSRSMNKAQMTIEQSTAPATAFPPGNSSQQARKSSSFLALTGLSFTSTILTAARRSRWLMCCRRCICCARFHFSLWSLE